MIISELSSSSFQYCSWVPGSAALVAFKTRRFIILEEGILPMCHTVSGRTLEEREREKERDRRGGKRQSVLTPIPAAKNSLRNKQLPTAAQSITVVGSSRQEGREGGRRRGGWKREVGAQRSEPRL